VTKSLPGNKKWQKEILRTIFKTLIACAQSVDCRVIHSFKENIITDLRSLHIKRVAFEVETHRQWQKIAQNAEVSHISNLFKHNH
jgi:hypothetical protein